MNSLRKYYPYILFQVLIILILALSLIPSYNMSNEQKFNSNFNDTGTQSFWWTGLYNWASSGIQQIPKATSSLIVMGPVTNYYEGAKINYLAKHGVHIILKLSWWKQVIEGNTLVGEPFQPLEHTPLDFFYNATYRAYVLQIINLEFKYVSPNWLYGVLLSEEEPGNAYDWMNWAQNNWVTTSAYNNSMVPFNAVLKYNQTYYQETGYYFKNVNDMTLKQQTTFNDWLQGKLLYCFNYLYDYIHQTYPKLKVMQEMFDWPTSNPWDVKGDIFLYQDYLTSSLNFEGLYEGGRAMHFVTQDGPYPKQLWNVLWAVDDIDHSNPVQWFHPQDSIVSGWMSYFSGVDAVGWFDLFTTASAYPWTSQSLNQNNHFSRLADLNKLLNSLPKFQPKSKILLPTFPAGLTNASLHGLFSSFDTQTFDTRPGYVSNIPLDNYKIIGINSPYPNSFNDSDITALQSYVDQGGILVIFGQMPTQSTLGVNRTSFFNYEKDLISGTILKNDNESIIISSRPNNYLNTSFQYTSNSAGLSAFKIINNKQNYYPLTSVQLVHSNGSIGPAQASFFNTTTGSFISVQTNFTTSLWYHDSSKPKSGGILLMPTWDLDANVSTGYISSLLTGIIEKAKSIPYLSNLDDIINEHPDPNVFTVQSILNSSSFLVGGVDYANDTTVNRLYDLNWLNIQNITTPFKVYDISGNQKALLGTFTPQNGFLRISFQLEKMNPKLLLITNTGG